jgi:formylglycine-generating enzyme required for sulfatase activity
VLPGDLGSGKTTFVHYLTYALAAAALDGGPSPLLAAESPLQGMFPVRLVLREVTARCIPPGASRGEAGMLWEALRLDIAVRLGEAAAVRLFPHLRRRLLEEGGLILLDGLDEAPEAGRRRRCLLEAVEALAAALPEDRSRVLVTARPYAYTDPGWRLAGFRVLDLAPFDEGQVARFVERWYRAVRPVMGWDEGTARGRQERLGEALRQRPYLADLATRPLLLTLMATLHTSWGQLPEDRGDLYEETVKLLLSRWQRAREATGEDGKAVVEPGIARVLAVGDEQIRAALHRLAFQAHQSQGQGAEREAVPADIDQGQVLAAFSPLLPDDINAQVLLDYLQTRAGLLVGRASGIYAFPRRSFQEYLAACHLADGQDFASELRDLLWQDLDWWRSVFLLGVGKAKQGGLGNAVHLVNVLVPEGPEEMDAVGDIHWQAAILAGQALLDLRFPSAARDKPDFAAVLKRLRRWLVVLLQTPDALSPRLRAGAGDVLGKLGDPRPGVGGVAGVVPGRHGPPALPDFVWCHVPAGPFRMGSREGEDGAFSAEHPQHPVELPAFLIARYPITNAQYRPFVQEGGYEEPRYWTPDGWAWRTGDLTPDLSPLDDVGNEEWKKRYAEWLAARRPEDRDRPFWWEHPRWGLPNRPVVGISWYEALAYCAWLSEQVRDSAEGQIDQWQVRQDGSVDLPDALTKGNMLQALRRLDPTIHLPSEAEWEKAARGNDGRPWPWGNEWLAGRANTDEAGIGETSPVGAFPAGASPCGALDMAGNVWEWTRSRWGRTGALRPDYDYPCSWEDGREELSGPDLRVVRGGSWIVIQGFARCASRGRGVPDDYDDDLGFRVVVSLASPES